MNGNCSIDIIFKLENENQRLKFTIEELNRLIKFQEVK